VHPTLRLAASLRSNQFYHVRLFARNEINIERVVCLVRCSCAFEREHRCCAFGVWLDAYPGGPKVASLVSRMLAAYILRRLKDTYPSPTGPSVGLLATLQSENWEGDVRAFLIAMALARFSK
jgi:hypothetical protein